MHGRVARGRATGSPLRLVREHGRKEHEVICGAEGEHPPLGVRLRALAVVRDERPLAERVRDDERAQAVDAARREVDRQHEPVIVEFDREPPRTPTTLVIAFGGWIDAGRAATVALKHLVRDLGADRVARIDPGEFVIFTQERPEVRLRPTASAICTGHGASSSRGSRTGAPVSCCSAPSLTGGGRPTRAPSSAWPSAPGRSG